MTPRNRNLLIIAAIAFLVVLGTILFFASKNNEPAIPESGGSGVPDPGTLILKNVDSPTSDTDKIPLSDFLSTDQQNNVIDQLQAVLRLKKPLPEYNASVTEGTVTVDYNTNDITFMVHVAEPKADYKIIINTVSDAITITDSAGKRVN